jgi:hypothetical protein
MGVRRESTGRLRHLYPTAMPAGRRQNVARVAVSRSAPRPDHVGSCSPRRILNGTCRKEFRREPSVCPRNFATREDQPPACSPAARSVGTHVNERSRFISKHRILHRIIGLRQALKRNAPTRWARWHADSLHVSNAACRLVESEPCAADGSQAKLEQIGLI